jgi:DNA-binding response OmpR family regulator
MESHRNADLPQVSHSHNPLASVGNIDRSRNRSQKIGVPEKIAIVTISNDPSYHRWLIGTIGKPPLALLPAWSISAALSLVERLQAAVVLFDDDVPGSNWRPFLAALDGMNTPPALIVTPRFAGERIWAEALNLGAFDLLFKPFDHCEATRVIAAAIRRMYPMFGSCSDYACSLNLGARGEQG